MTASSMGILLLVGVIIVQGVQAVLQVICNVAVVVVVVISEAMVVAVMTNVVFLARILMNAATVKTNASTAVAPHVQDG